MLNFARSWLENKKYFEKHYWTKDCIDCCSKWYALSITVALCLSFTFLWYDMVWYLYAMICYFCAMLWDIKKWHDMVCYRMAWYGMLCFEIWVNVPSFTEELHLFCIFQLRFTDFSLYKNTLLIILDVKRL